MKIKSLCIIACATMMACNNQNEATNRVELPGVVDNEAFAANVESISVMNLQMDDSWTIVDNPILSFADNYIYISEPRQIRLACFDRQTGEKLSDRIIKGRGPGEITFLNTTFCIGDTLCVCTAKVAKKFDHNFKYLDDLCEFDSQLYGYQPVRMNNGDYAMMYSPFSIAMDTVPVPVIFLTDKSFNIKSKYFTILPSMTPISGSSPTYYTKGDTIRCFMPLDNNLYTLLGDTKQITELAVPNPLTNDALTGAEDPFAKALEYDGMFGSLCESGRFIVFMYHSNHDDYTAMVDRQTNHAVSIIYNEEPATCTSGVVVDFFNSIAILQTNDNCIYARCRIRNMNRLLEGYDNLLDARLKKTQAEYRTYLERNANYIKGLEPEEREVANVLIKIKLKD
ncbi:MAG: 6-bladed beta-propeller [Salinivirgaceae bacterium]|nr:6-bladed beta-propeller [Salinivirgaceae bacterium]